MTQNRPFASRSACQCLMSFSITSKIRFCPVPCLTTRRRPLAVSCNCLPYRPPRHLQRSLGDHPLGRSRLYPPPGMVPAQRCLYAGGAALQLANGRHFHGEIHLPHNFGKNESISKLCCRVPSSSHLPSRRAGGRLVLRSAAIHS